MQKVRLIRNLMLLLIVFVSCESRNQSDTERHFNLEKNEIKGYQVPADSMTQPTVIQAGKPLLVKVQHPRIVGTREHFVSGIAPLTFPAGNPEKCTPGQNGFEPAKHVTARGVTFLPGFPETVIVKNSGSKDINPHGFSSFGTIQGLKSNQIRCLMQDRDGNLWFSSDDGVSRYDGKYLTHFQFSNGTYQNSIVLCMMQDRSGSLWFGTFGGGVLCFDGKKVTQYTTREGLSNNTVNSIIQDREGFYWMGTSGGGVSRFDGREFVHYSTGAGLSSNQIRSVFQDHDGIFWFGTFGKGVSRFDGTSFTNYSVKEGFPATHIATILQDKKGNIWFGTFNQGIVKFDGHSFVQFDSHQGLCNNSVLSMVQEVNGNFWLGTSGGGISKFDGRHFTNFNEEDGLTNNFVKCCLIGRQGNLWFGTRDGGLVRYNKNLFAHYTENEGLAGSKVLGIIQDKKDNIWFGTFGGGITRYDGKEFVSYSLKESSRNDFVYAFLQSDNGDLWFGSDGGGITRFDGKNLMQFTQKEGLCNNGIRCLLKDHNNQMWIGSYGGGVSKFDGKIFTNYSMKSGLSGDKIMCMLEDRNGAMWFGTDGGGVTKFDGRIFTHFTVKEGLSSNTITSMLQDQNGSMWFGSSGGGLVRFDGKYGTIFTKNEGLSNNFVTSLSQDKIGNLWIGTRLGPNVLKANLLNVDLDKLRIPIFKNYSYDDGFLGIGCNLNSIMEDKKGTIWIGSTNRLSAILPADEVPDTVPPNAKLTNVHLFSENIPWSKIGLNKDTSYVLDNGLKVGPFKFTDVSKWYFLPEDLKLSYDNNFLGFSFIGISQKQTPKIRYQYQLEGVDNSWSTLTDLTEISYGNLKPGSYTFKVKAMNSEGIWSKECRYSFSIDPPWWKSWWFYLLLVSGIVSLVYSIFKIREHDHRIQKELLRDKIEEQTHELKEKNSELEIMNNELLNSNSEKDKFFSIIAHDVRGPLSTFLLFTEMLAENLQSYDMSEIEVMAGSMKDSASNLFKLLENLLEWTKMQRGLIQYNPEQLNIIEILNDSIETIHHSAKSKSIALIIEIPLDMAVLADKNMFGSVLRNLVSNAIKFTPRGGKVTIKAKKGKEDVIQISVSDTGIGMNDQMVNDLFKIDAHVNRRGTDGEASVGLGLLLCKDFVEKMNGSIWVESNESKGSTFYFTLAAVV